VKSFGLDKKSLEIDKNDNEHRKLIALKLNLTS